MAPSPPPEGSAPDSVESDPIRNASAAPSVGRTTTLSSRGGSVSYEPRKRCMPPRSAGRVAERHYCLPAPSEPYVIVSHHTAQAFTNAPHGTRPSPTPTPYCGPDGDSSGAATPGCPPWPCRPPRGAAGGGVASPFPGSAAGRRPGIAPPAPATSSG